MEEDFQPQKSTGSRRIKALRRSLAPPVSTVRLSGGKRRQSSEPASSSKQQKQRSIQAVLLHGPPKSGPKPTPDSLCQSDRSNPPSFVTASLKPEVSTLQTTAPAFLSPDPTGASKTSPAQGLLQNKKQQQLQTHKLNTHQSHDTSQQQQVHNTASVPKQTPCHLSHQQQQQQQGDQPQLDPEVEPAGTCPICGCNLADVSHTEVGRQAHVNACLDAKQLDLATPDQGLVLVASSEACKPHQHQPQQQWQQQEPCTQSLQQQLRSGAISAGAGLCSRQPLGSGPPPAVTACGSTVISASSNSICQDHTSAGAQGAPCQSSPAVLESMGQGVNDPGHDRRVLGVIPPQGEDPTAGLSAPQPTSFAAAEPCLEIVSAHCTQPEDEHHHQHQQQEGVEQGTDELCPVSVEKESKDEDWEADTAIQMTQAQNSTATWLQALGAGAHIEAFLEQEVDLDVLPELTDKDLQGLGVQDAALRARLLEAAAALGEAEGSQEDAMEEVAHDSLLAKHESPGAPDCSNSWDGTDLGRSLAPAEGQQPQQEVEQQQRQQQMEQIQQQQPCQLSKGETPGLHSQHHQQQHGKASCSGRSVVAPITNTLWSKPLTSMFNQKGPTPARSIKYFFSPKGHQQQQQQGLQQENRQGWVQQNQGQSGDLQCGELYIRKEQQQAARAEPLDRSGPGKVAAAPVLHQGGRSGLLPVGFFAWRTLPGTNFVVDCFGKASKGLRCKSWFLTHFHADHYGGLTKHFKQGVIYCTPITAALVSLKIKVPPQMLQPVPLRQPIMVEGVKITFLEANHCPGAALILAEPPGGLPPVLHTGDARLDPEVMQSQPELQALVGRRCVLVLDTTYCDPQYTFPSQQQVVAEALKAVKAESFNPRTLFLFGTYTIGKERLFLQVADALDAKLYVAAAKRAVLGCIGLSAQHAARLTTNHLESNLHVVPMFQVTLQSMEKLLQRYKGRYTTIVGFQPTGWSQARASKGSKLGKRMQRGTVVLYQVPYSEHSSFAELQSFVSWLQPRAIIPSVGNDQGPKLRQMLQLLQSSGAGGTNAGKKTQGPMEAFARRAG